MAVTPQKMSLAEFLLLPDPIMAPAYELIDGIVTQKCWPTGPHSATQGGFAYRIEAFAEPRQIARVFIEARVILGDDCFVPDLVVCQWDNIPDDGNGNLPDDFVTPPDLTVEVASPEQSFGNLLQRCRHFVACGIRVVVLADPVQRTIHIVRASGESGPLRDADAIDIADVVPGFEMSMNDLFLCLRARPSSGEYCNTQ